MMKKKRNDDENSKQTQSVCINQNVILRSNDLLFDQLAMMVRQKARATYIQQNNRKANT